MRRLLLPLLALALAMGVLPATAQATPSSFVAMLSDPYDWIGGGAQRLYYPGNASITIQGTAADLTVNVSGGTLGDSYGMEFAAARGQNLRPGRYVDAQRAPFRDAGRPGISITGDGRGCNTVSGLFEIKDIASSSSGAVNRLWLLYEQHCEGYRSALFGEIKLGEPPSTDPALVLPLTLRWPAGDVGRSSTVVPATIVASGGPVTVSGVSLVGSNPSDFAIRSNECSGRTLTTGASCQVWLRFVPAAPGTRLAVLRFSGPGGARHDVALQGFAYGGRTRVQMTSDPGDYIGGGRSWSYTFANGSIGAAGSRQWLGFGVVGVDGSDWSADFVPAAGDIIAPGTYLGATRYPFNGTGPGMDIGGNGRGCNDLDGQFTVNSVSWWPDGTLRGASVSFEQHCEGAPPALRGLFEFRAGDTTPLASWMMAGGPATPRAAKAARPCVVPRVVGKSLRSARRAITGAHCRVGRVRRAHSRRVRRGMVLRQSPRAGRRLKRGARVSLVVGRR